MAETLPDLCDHPGCKVQIAHVHDEQGRIIWESINWQYLDSLSDSGMKTAIGGDIAAFWDSLTPEEEEVTIDRLRRQRDLAEAALTRVETERIAAIRERDEAWALLVRIGQYLREHFEAAHDGWTPGSANEIYRSIDALAAKENTDEHDALLGPTRRQRAADGDPDRRSPLVAEDGEAGTERPGERRTNP